MNRDTEMINGLAWIAGLSGFVFGALLVIFLNHLFPMPTPPEVTSVERECPVCITPVAPDTVLRVDTVTVLAPVAAKLGECEPFEGGVACVVWNER